MVDSTNNLVISLIDVPDSIDMDQLDRASTYYYNAQALIKLQ